MFKFSGMLFRLCGSGFGSSLHRTDWGRGAKDEGRNLQQAILCIFGRGPAGRRHSSALHFRAGQSECNNQAQQRVQLQEAYHRVFPLCALVVGVSMAGVGHEIVAKSADPEKVWKNRQFPQVHRKIQAREILDEKHLCILEDLILEHQRNLKIMKETNYSS